MAPLDVSSQFHFDPQTSGLSDQISNASDYHSRKFRDATGDKIEREIKYLLPNWRGSETFLQFHKNIPDTPFSDTVAFTPRNSSHINNLIFHADPQMCGRDILLSIALDTLDLKIMKEAKQQVRTRGRICMDNFNKTGVICPNWQFTIKDLLSAIDVNAEGRDELEPDMPTQDINSSIDSYLHEHRSDLHSVYKGINSKNLFVTALGITPRGSFNIQVYVPTMRAFVTFEACADPNDYFTPNGFHVGEDDEIEMEAKEVHAPKDTEITNKFMQDAYIASRHIIQNFMTESFPDFKKSPQSKMERAMMHVGEDVFQTHKQGCIADLFQDIASYIGLPFTDDRHSCGLSRAVHQKITAIDVARNERLARVIINKAEDPCEFLTPYGPFHFVTFKTGSGCKLPAMRQPVAA